MEFIPSCDKVPKIWAFYKLLGGVSRAKQFWMELLSTVYAVSVRW